MCCCCYKAVVLYFAVIILSAINSIVSSWQWNIQSQSRYNGSVIDVAFVNVVTVVAVNVVVVVAAAFLLVFFFCFLFFLFLNHFLLVDAHILYAQELVTHFM